ncbi:MAG: LPS export ABC transporter periplasmic protein LptC [Coxiella sp. (in: Bacteria)]|nr:MAG: LPS export ABC transporter periplasmic protein LptC [Coxiella sp. (in: g-proteobacteria)]
MSHKTVTSSLIVIALIVIGVSIYFANATLTTLSAPNKNQYDAFVTQLHQTQFSKTGNIANTSTSPLLRHYPDGNYDLFNKPHIILHNNQGRWIVDADKGRSTGDNKTITLWGHVTMVQPATKTTPKTTIITTHATIHPDQSLATTDAWVTIHRGGTVIEGRGAHANLKTGVIKLLSQTRGHYVPQQITP